MRLTSVVAGVILMALTMSRPASAQTIVYRTLEASLSPDDPTSIAGTNFNVYFSYDADQVNPEGESYVSLNSFDFMLGDAYFTRADIFQGGQVIFRDGEIENVTASYQVRMPAGSPVKNITFGFGTPMGIAYIDLDDNYGSGSFTVS